MKNSRHNSRGEEEFDQRGNNGGQRKPLPLAGCVPVPAEPEAQLVGTEAHRRLNFAARHEALRDITIDGLFPDREQTGNSLCGQEPHQGFERRRGLECNGTHALTSLPIEPTKLFFIDRLSSPQVRPQVAGHLSMAARSIQKRPLARASRSSASGEQSLILPVFRSDFAIQLFDRESERIACHARFVATLTRFPRDYPIAAACQNSERKFAKCACS